jgi:mono/diheme cytochrome c family protein
VPDRGARVRVRNVSVVSAVARGDGTTDVYFKDFYRTYRRDGSIGIKGRWELGYGDDNCAQCHKSGVLPIFPVEGSVAREELPAVEEVNRRFRGYGPPRFGGYLDGTKFGPGLGSALAPEAGRGARSGEGPHPTNEGRALTCAACHRPDYLGALNWPMNETLISSYVKGGLMPRGYELRAAERGELYERLIREYFDTDEARPGVLKSWLTGRLRGAADYSRKPTEWRK